VSGTVKLKFLDDSGKSGTEQNLSVNLQPFLRTDIPVSMTLPSKAGGYVLIAEFTPEKGSTVISRRFLKVGQSSKYAFYNIDPKSK
jgi:hypothetical protein